MSLTVGELNAILTVDDRTVDPALRRAEQALRQSGQRMAGDADDAGQQAGQQLGQGLVRGADGQWRNIRGELVDAVTAAAAEAEAEAHNAGRRMGAGLASTAVPAARQAGQQAGDAAGDGLAQGTEQGADEAAGAATTKLEKLKMGAAAIGAAAGAVLMAAMSEAMDQSRISGRLGAQLGATPAEAQRYGKIAGALYANAVTEDFQGAADTISATMRAGIAPPQATEAQLQSLATKVSDLASTFELDLGQTANAVGQAIKSGLVKDGAEALDIFTRGLQVMGPRADDLADTFNEYGTVFRQTGLDAKTATGLLSQGMKAGARDTDIVADSIKEFVLITQGGGDKVDEAFAKIHMSGKEMTKVFSEGGPKAATALDKVFDELRKIKDPAERAQLAVSLFGTKAEDAQKALFALDPSSAADALGEVGGAADKMGDTLRDNAGTRLEQFKRGMMQGLVNFLGGPVLGSIEKAKGALGRIWDNAGKDGSKGADRVISVAQMIGQRVVEKVRELGPKIITGLTEAGSKAAEWVMANPTKVLKIAAIAGAITMAIVLLPSMVALAIQAAAAAIMIGFGKKLVSALMENVPQWWDSFKGWVSAKASEAGSVLGGLGSAFSAWFSGLWGKYVSGPVSRTGTSLMNWVRGLPGRAVAALSPLGGRLSASASAHWERFKAASIARALSMVAWVRGLPSRINKGVGSLGSLLTTKGRQVVQGLWSGIQSMGGWISSKIRGWVKSAIPGPIAKAMGISSPSKVTKAQGRWIARGLVDGLTGSSKQVRAASYKLVDIVRDSLTGKRRATALKKINKSAGWLDWLAKQETKVAGKLKTATKKMEDLRKARSALAADVKKGVLGDADITKQDTGGWPQTADTILAGLKQDRIAAETFTKHLAALKKKGVRSDLIAQIAQAGVTGGASAAAALANANSSQVKQINAQQKLLTTAAGKAGTTAGDAMYKAGIQAAQGLVNGLKKQQKTIENTMLRMAKAMTKSIRKALGIKSPSRVMAQVGVHTAQGLIKGVDGQRSAVNASMASLVDTPAPGSWDSASARARAGAAQRVVLELNSSGKPEDNYLVERVRRGIRNKGGKDPVLVLAGRRRG